MAEEKSAKIIEHFKKALEAGREAKSDGEICVVVKLKEGGIRFGSVTIQKQVV